MNIENAKEGMTVRVSTNLVKTKKRCQLDSEGIMLNMRGKIFNINRVSSGSIYIMHRNYEWTFSASDIHRVKLNTTPKKTSMMFDTKNIVT